ncbi:hypothetical protein FRUB_06252 [Fimbriiglobus ruber]|uniref:Helicase HerA-like C-terminal domain-containing protein n=1 Tax=Fimbriiglobus ruber TaxID=1908690 RepID=A0A225DC55_9BACT|nr:hypothetical protein FRUB_06252 [Fimbriiglobus ruber]
MVRLARGLLDALDIVPEAERQQLYDDLIEPEQAARLVYRFADIAVQYPKFRGIDADLLRAVLFMIPNDGRIRSRVLKWLRCEDMNRFERELIGDLVPRPGAEMPMRTLIGLGQLMYTVHSAALVLLVDQIEEVLDHDKIGTEKGEVLRHMVNAVVDVMDGVPNAVIVLACLKELFKVGKNYLPKPKLDRLERDPDPVNLSHKRTEAEIAAMIKPRLEAVFEAADITWDSRDPIAPYTDKDLKGLILFRPRDILDNLRRHREACFKAGQWVSPTWIDSLTTKEAGQSDKHADGNIDWQQIWNDFRNAQNLPIPRDEPQLAELLKSTIKAVSAEMSSGVFFGAEQDERFVSVEVHGPGNTVDKLYVAVCDKGARGLASQIEDVATKAGEIPAVVVRSTEFPKGPTAASTRALAKLIAPRGKGRRVVVADSNWRAMAAFREFHGKHHKEPGFTDWQRADRPLAELPAVSAILALDKLLATMPTPVSPPPPPLPPAGLPKEVAAAKPVAPPPPPTVMDAVRLGASRGQLPFPVELKPKDLCRHAAFLGGSGSGKTTAALTVIEQFLLAGIPAVLLDRKGDLSQYADPAAWTIAESDPERAARRDQLRAAVDVHLYTPGADAGRPLAIPIVPSDLGQLTAADREQVAQYAAASLGAMMGYKGKNPDAKLVILQKAIEVLARAAGATVTVKAVQKLVADRDDALTNAVDGFEDKHYKRLAEDLLTLAHQHRRLLEGADQLDVDTLLGRGTAAVAGKVRLTVINTQFLGDPVTTDFWVSQFLLAVDRWRAKNPAPDGILQAVFLFDEADQYLPATRQPATKGPMERLLKMARSAGIGIFLATQSPGDLDYKCRDQVLTWLIGRVKEPVAINKLKPMLEGARVDATSKLPNQEVGQFYLVRESDVTAIKVDRNLIPTSQLPENRVLAAAQRTAKAAAT